MLRSIQKNGRFKYNLISFSFFGPSFLIYSAFFIVPSIMGFLYSFTSWNGISSKMKFVGLDNYIEIFKDDRFYHTIANTLIITVIQVIFFNFFALFLAAILERTINKTVKSTLRSLYFFPYIISYVIIAVIWNYMLNFRDGIINQILRSAGLDFLAADWLGSPGLVIFTISAINIWAFIGFYLVIYMASIQAIPDHLFESCHIDGCGFIKVMRYVIFPLVAPAFTVNMVISVAWGLSTFEPILILTKGGPGFASETISYYVYWSGFLGSRQGYGTAISFLLFVITLMISIFQVKVLQKKEVEF